MAKLRPSKKQFFGNGERLHPEPVNIQKQNLLGVKGAPKGGVHNIKKGAAGNLHPLLNVQGAAKGGGTLRAYDVGGRIYWFIEGYDSPSSNPANLSGAIQL